MLCRATIMLPYITELIVPLATELKQIEYEEFPYRIVIFPLQSSSIDFRDINPKTKYEITSLSAVNFPQIDTDLLVDGYPTTRRNLLQIDFIKDDFDRAIPLENGTNGSVDPNYEYIISTANRFLLHLSLVCENSGIKSLQYDETYILLRYLNNDGTPLPPEPKKARTFFHIPKRINISIIDKAIWETIQGLYPNYSPYKWEVLLSNAKSLLPNVGPAIVLASTALEIMIAEVCDDLASRVNLPEGMWKWVMDRGDYRKDPSVDEQFTSLLMILCGKSLKDQGKLWEGYRKLRDARNNFVHEGYAATGRNKQKVTANEAMELIKVATEIVLWIENETGTLLKRPSKKTTDHQIIIQRPI